MDAVRTAHTTGYKVAALEIKLGVASFTQAEERGLFPGDSEARDEWDRGYDDCVCAHRLGHDVEAMIGFEFYAPSLESTPSVIFALLDGRWDRRVRPDPRK
jgi:hypothetical protein